MEQLEYTICVKVTYFQKTRQIVFSYIFFYILEGFFWLGALQSQPTRSIQNSKYIQKLKVFEKYRTFSGKLDGSPKSSFYSHHIPIIFCDGSNNLIIGFSEFIRILKKWVQGIWN